MTDAWSVCSIKFRILSRMSRSVAPSLKQIVNRLRTVGDELAIDDAKAWLQSSASSDRVLEVIKLLTPLMRTRLTQ